MSDAAFQKMYRQEYIAGFEKRQALSRHTVTTEVDIKGNEAIFLVADSGDADAVTRGLNGRIPGRPDNLNQFTCTLTEWHDKPERTDFNIYASQGDGRRIMQEGSQGVMNRKFDKDIHSALDAATQTKTMTQTNQGTFLADVLDIVVTLSENNANEDFDNIFALITPAFRANLQTLKQFSSVDWVRTHAAFENVSKSRAFNWNGINWIVDSALTGVGTATSTCYVYNKKAIGHACDMDRITTRVGYDEEDAYSWARTSAYLGSKLLQNSGVIKVTHDDTSIINTVG